MRRFLFSTLCNVIMALGICISVTEAHYGYAAGLFTLFILCEFDRLRATIDQ